jgi:aminoglycoside phosphotransferase (APT) family kinase protein
MNEAELAARLASAWQRAGLGAVLVENLRRLSAGASAQTWLFEAAGTAGREKQVLQLFAGGDNFPGALDKHSQARIQQIAAECGIRTPAVVLTVGEENGLPPGFVSRHVDGETLGRRLVADAVWAGARKQLGTQCAQQLAAIHAMELGKIEWLPLRGAADQRESLATIHRGYGEALPVFEMSLAWLARHLPPPCPPRLVHGDFRTGNFAVDRQGLAAIFDWELAHRGDAMEDLGWLCMRSWRFGADERAAGGFATRADFYAAYEAASGTAVNAAAVRYWEVLGTLKWGVICQWFGHQHLSGQLTALEPAVIGRRVSEVELQLLELIHGHAD